MPKSRQRCSTSLSSSSKLPSSSSSSTRSRAVSLPSRCWRSRRSAPPPSSARRVALAQVVERERAAHRASSRPQAAAAARGRRRSRPRPASTPPRRSRRRTGPARRRRPRTPRAACRPRALAHEGQATSSPKRRTSFSKRRLAAAADVLVDRHRLAAGLRGSWAFTFSQSSRNFLRPLSVSGCLSERVEDARRHRADVGAHASRPRSRASGRAGWPRAPRSRSRSGRRSR